MNYPPCTGRCEQGHCPCAKSNEIQPMRKSWIVVNVLLLVFLLGSLGHMLDRRSEEHAQPTPEQRELHKELAAAKLCREQHGESLVSWSATGELVCIPRGYIRRKTQVAIR